MPPHSPNQTDARRNATRTCRCPGCDRTPESGRFCSEQCRVKFDHLRDDARDAMRADRERAEEECR